MIESVDTWMMYHRAKNERSHTYDQKVAIEVFKIVKADLILSLSVYGP